MRKIPNSITLTQQSIHEILNYQIKPSILKPNILPCSNTEKEWQKIPNQKQIKGETRTYINENGEQVVTTFYDLGPLKPMEPLSWKEKAAIGVILWLFGVSSVYYNLYLQGMDEEAIKRHLADPNNRPSSAWGLVVTAGIVIIVAIAKGSDK